MHVQANFSSTTKMQKNNNSPPPGVACEVKLGACLGHLIEHMSMQNSSGHL